MSLTQKYGKFKEFIYYGETSTIRLHEKKHIPTTSSSSSPTRTEFYAIKVFHRSSANLARSEYCIASCLQHPNMIRTLDLLSDERGSLYEVMEYQQSTTLYHLISVSRKTRTRTKKEGLTTLESDCFFKQLLRGIDYMHTQGVAHRNIKPENILITLRGQVKIIDFGNAECFRAPWEQRPHLTRRLSGTIPYIAPEEYVNREFDPRAVDVWAAGVTYIAMRTGRLPWFTAVKRDDELYVAYLNGRREERGYEPIESFRRECCRNVIYAMLNPNWERRITASQILRSEWVTGIEVCDAGAGEI
ncbi:hypothetical protein Plec18167_002832 [Paecilomyces lecythidis]|uniref:non-specific serine/threonine protein kinase n=1 Tax=Paecilomyces lecythidis TaxID=3004212 RepID=A0ABR3Y3D6_9EURO